MSGPSEDAVIFNDRINLETSMNNIIICPRSLRTFGANWLHERSDTMLDHNQRSFQ